MERILSELNVDPITSQEKTMRRLQMELVELLEIGEHEGVPTVVTRWFYGGTFLRAIGMAGKSVEDYHDDHDLSAMYQDVIS
jgi:hypothetical protein